jgi:HEPN domain-containing protein
MAEVGSYLYIAERDLKDAYHLFDVKSYSTCGRLCEQAAEKALKHFIHMKGSSADYKLLQIHKPLRLYAKCTEYNLGLNLTKEEMFVLGNLDSYYYDTNYPGNAYFELEEEDAKSALALAEVIVKHVAEKITQHPAQA